MKIKNTYVRNASEIKSAEFISNMAIFPHYCGSVASCFLKKCAFKKEIDKYYRETLITIL